MKFTQATVAIIFSTFIVTSTWADNTTYCNQSCGVGKSAIPVKYPFGFSTGCQIFINCSANGDMRIGEFQVQKVTSQSILIDIPPKCNRSFEAIKPLFHRNYAITRQNNLLLHNCSSPNQQSGCVISSSLLMNDFESGLNCGNISCYEEQRGGESSFMSYRNLTQWRCLFLFSSMAVDRETNTESVLQPKTVELEWWLEGPCNCSPNSNCTVVPLPDGRSGFRCHCKEGFGGDGFADGQGCLKDIKQDSRRIIKIAAIVGTISFATVAYFLWVWMAKRRAEQRREILFLNRGEACPNFSDDNMLRENINQAKLRELPLFSFEKLATATNNFDIANKLGQGGFGPVYKGKFLYGQEIAVKRLSRSSKQGLEEFMNEVEVISRLQHRNLVRLLGCCIEGEEKMLIYEYMPNKSLDAFLFDPLKQKLLHWRRRFNIIEGISRGLLYLHRDSRLRIIHRDLKASNILLDEELNPKISDFGMARIFGGNQDQADTRRIVGTYGYMSPEYAMEGRFSEKSDVFSFGVLLLEIISGRRNTSFYNDEHSLSLLGYAWKLWNENNILALIDPTIFDECFQMEISRCIHVGLLCVQEFSKNRPTISTVLSMLDREITDLPTPKQPAFTERQIVSNTESCQPCPKRSSINNVTITVIDEGR